MVELDDWTLLYRIFMTGYHEGPDARRMKKLMAGKGYKIDTKDEDKRHIRSFAKALYLDTHGGPRLKWRREWSRGDPSDEVEKRIQASPKHVRPRPPPRHPPPTSPFSRSPVGDKKPRNPEPRKRSKRPPPPTTPRPVSSTALVQSPPTAKEKPLGGYTFSRKTVDPLLDDWFRKLGIPSRPQDVVVPRRFLQNDWTTPRHQVSSPPLLLEGPSQASLDQVAPPHQDSVPMIDETPTPTATRLTIQNAMIAAGMLSLAGAAGYAEMHHD